MEAASHRSPAVDCSHIDTSLQLQAALPTAMDTGHPDGRLCRGNCLQPMAACCGSHLGLRAHLLPGISEEALVCLQHINSAQISLASNDGHVCQ